MPRRSASSARADRPSSTPLPDRINEFILTNLREEYPYMQIDAVKEAAKASVRTLEAKIAEQQPRLCEAKEHSGFMSLSAELRLMIYELALQPQKDGEGGIKGSRAIFIGVDDIAGDGCSRRTQMNGYRTTSWIQQPALTKLSRQVRSECLPVYYGNHFVVEVGGCSIGEKKKIWHLSRAIWRHGMPYTGSIERRPVQWLQRIGPYNVSLIKKLDILYAMPLSQSVMTLEKMKEHLAFRNIPVPTDISRILGIREVRKSTGELFSYWYPLHLNSVDPTNRRLDFPGPSKDSLAYSSVDRKETFGFTVAWSDEKGQYMMTETPRRKRKRKA